MNFKDALCKTFCDGLSLREVPAGLAVGTPFERPDGDRVGFYLVRGSQGWWRIEDDGATVPLLVASGLNLAFGQRAAEFQSLLKQVGAEYDEETGELRTEWLPESALAAASLRFVTLMLRIFDLLSLRPEKVAKTFREDAMAAMRKTFAGKARIVEDIEEVAKEIAPELAEFQADAVLTAAGLPPLAVFIATSENRIYEAVLARWTAHYKLRTPYKVAAILESERPTNISTKMQQRARNHLDASPSFHGDEIGAMQRLHELMFETEIKPPLH